MKQSRNSFETKLLEKYLFVVMKFICYLEYFFPNLICCKPKWELARVNISRLFQRVPPNLIYLFQSFLLKRKKLKIRQLGNSTRFSASSFCTKLFENMNIRIWVTNNPFTFGVAIRLRYCRKETLKKRFIILKIGTIAKNENHFSLRMKAY